MPSSFPTFPTSCGIYRKWALGGVENKVGVCNGGGYPTESRSHVSIREGQGI